MRVAQATGSGAGNTEGGEETPAAPEGGADASSGAASQWPADSASPLTGPEIPERIAEFVRPLWNEAQAPHEALDLEPTLVRLGAALFLGGLIGIERERRDKPAGLRTHMLISLASALFIIVALEIAISPGHDERTLAVDPTRVVEAVTAGVAFLAAGSIIRSGRDVKGVTTGAAMWMASAIGVSCGLGYIDLAAVVTAASLLVLFVIRAIERR